MFSNSTLDIIHLNYGQKIVFNHPIHKSDICCEAYGLGKILSVEKNPINDLWVAERLQPNTLTNLIINDFLCSALTGVNSGDSVNMLIPEHINQLSLAASAYRSAKMHDISVSVKIHDNHLIISRKEINLDIIKAVNKLLSGQNAILNFSNEKELNKLRTMIHRNSYGIAVKTNKVGNTLVVTPIKENKEPQITKCHHLSEKATFDRWLDNMPWDEPYEYPIASLSTGNYNYFSKLAARHRSKSVKVKKGLFTKHSLCYAKEKGFIVIRYRGETIYTTMNTNLTSLLSVHNEHVRDSISRHLLTIGRSIEDVQR